MPDPQQSAIGSGSQKKKSGSTVHKQKTTDSMNDRVESALPSNNMYGIVQYEQANGGRSPSVVSDAEQKDIVPDIHKK